MIKFEIYAPDSSNPKPYLIKRIFKDSNRIGEKLIEIDQGVQAFKIAYRNIGDSPMKCTYKIFGTFGEIKSGFPFI